jgi:putative SOS response-associated peptidase YedK
VGFNSKPVGSNCASKSETGLSGYTGRSYPESICGRFTNTVGPEELTEQIGGQLGVQIRETVRTDRWDVRPTDDVPAIVAQDGCAEPRMLRWALVPANAGTVKTKRPWINAKVETLRSKGSYFGVAPDAAHRALILADGFYDYLQ